jgi:hypothetical protein
VRPILSAVLLLSLVLPLTAQQLPAERIGAAREAVEAAALPENAFRNLWCGALFGAERDRLAAAAEYQASEEPGRMRDRLYQAAALELIATGMSEGDFIAVAEDVSILAAAGEPGPTLAECEAPAQ